MRWKYFGNKSWAFGENFVEHGSKETLLRFLHVGTRNPEEEAGRN